VPTQASWLPAALLLAYGAAFAARAIGVSVPAFDDHPGQLARLWHVVREGPAPWAWHAGWWAGYPEMQFYPPGFFYLGAALSWLTLGGVAPPAVYTALVWLAYLAPGVTAYGLLRRLLGDGWRALPGAFLVLTFTGDPGGGSPSGVEGGVHIGMAAARLAWAMLPLLALGLVRWIEGCRFPRGAVLLVAAIVLTHPAHGPAALAVVAAAALVRSGRGGALLHAVGAVGVALALIGFWLLPLLLRLEHTRALAWGSLTSSSLLHPTTALVAGLLVLALARRSLPAWRALLHSLWLAVAVVAADALVLEPLGVRFLPADRVADGAWMLALVVAGLGAGVVAGAMGRGVRAPVAAIAMIAVLVAFGIPGHALTLWPRAAEWPSAQEVRRGVRMDDLARTLAQAPAGRVLFVRSGVPLVFGTEWYRPHTHVTALVPAMTGREIVGGTFTHGSPIAALVYRGDAGPRPIDRLAEHLDGHSLFGRPLDVLDATTFDGHARRLRVAAVVALEDDAPRLPFVADPARYRRHAVPPFLVFTALDPPRAPRRRNATEWDVPVSGDAGAWVSTGIGYYPLWRAEAAGHPLAVRRGDAGDLEVRLETTTTVDVRLRYGAAMPELAGAALSALALLALLADRWRQRADRAAATE
jgi:hypothetical protein